MKRQNNSFIESNEFFKKTKIQNVEKTSFQKRNGNIVGDKLNKFGIWDNAESKLLNEVVSEKARKYNINLAQIPWNQYPNLSWDKIAKKFSKKVYIHVVENSVGNIGLIIIIRMLIKANGKMKKLSFYKRKCLVY